MKGRDNGRFSSRERMLAAINHQELDHVPGRSQRQGEQLRMKEQPYPTHVRVDHGCVGRGKRLHVLREPIDVGVDRKRLARRIFDLAKVLAVDHGVVLHGAQLLPQAVQPRVWSGARQVVHAAVKDIALALPGRTQAAGNAVQLE